MEQQIKQNAHSIVGLVRAHPWWLMAILVGVVVVLSLISSVVPRSIHFSYDGQNCTNKITPFPQLLTSTEQAYKITIEDTVSVGGIDLLGRQLCVTPLSAPKVGTQTARLSIGKMIWPSLYYSVITPEPPAITLDPIKKPIAAARTLVLPISIDDKVFSYRLVSDNRSVDCQPAEGRLQCEVASLHLVQGESQKLELQREFEGDMVATIFDDAVDILPATKVTDTSVKDGQTVYTRGQPFYLTLDKPLLTASASLQRHNGEELIKHEVEIAINEHQVIVTPKDDDLPRSSNYELTLGEVEAKDGSGLDKPHVVGFNLSGGPRVSNVSVGATGIEPHARIVLQLDQVRHESQNITDIVNVQGAPANITATGDAIVVTLAGAGRCADIIITVSKELTSEHDIKADQDWSWRGRTRCYTVETVGYSASGQPINAYIYGNGSTTYLYTAGIHGNELSSVYTIQSWMSDLEANPGQIPADARVVVIPRINPDGVARSRRDNNNNVNLNRNFPTHNWSSTIITGSGEQAGAGGYSAGSEPETKALMNATYRYAPRFVITYHSSGSLVNSNDVGVSITAGQRYAQLARYWFIPNSQTTATFGFEMTGTYEDWLLERGVAAILIELNTNTGNHFTQNRTAMWAMLGY